MAKNEKTSAEQYRAERKARLAKAAKKNAKKSISSDTGDKAAKVVAAVLVVALLGGIAGMIVNISGIIPRNTTALMVGDQKVSQAEYSFYYTSVYNLYANYANYGYSFGFDPSADPASQSYTDYFGEIEGFSEDETPTWQDYFEYEAKERLKYTKAAVKAAAEEEVTLTDEDIASVEDTMQELEDSAKSSNFSLSSFLRRVYGKGLTVGIYRTILEEQTLAERLQTVKTEQFEQEVTNKQINKEYSTNEENYATVTYRSYVVQAEKVEVAAESESDEPTEEVTEETMAAAKEIADSIAQSESVRAFLQAVSDNEEKNDNDDYKEFLTDDSLTLTEDELLTSATSSSDDEDFQKWIGGRNTEVGSTFVLEQEDTGYTVYMMIDPMHKAADKPTYDVRHILVGFTEDEESDESDEADEDATEVSDEDAQTEDTTEATEATEAEDEEQVEVETIDVSAYEGVNIILDVDADSATDKQAYKKAQDILVEYLNGEHTAEAFGELAHEYTEDTGSAETGGLYEDVNIGDMVAEFESWSIDGSRKPGDVGIVESTHGYHIMYYVGSGTVTWKDAVIESLASTRLNTYTEELTASDDVAVSEVNDKAMQDVAAFLSKLIKEQNQQVENQLY